MSRTATAETPPTVKITIVAVVPYDLQLALT